VLVLEQTGLPAALLLGPMLAGIVFSVGGAGLRLPIPPFSLAQAAHIAQASLEDEGSRRNLAAGCCRCEKIGASFQSFHSAIWSDVSR